MSKIKNHPEKKEVEEKSRSIFMLLFLIVFLNVLDVFYTLYYVNEMGLQEMNPWAVTLLSMGPWIFITGKMLTIVLCCCALWYAYRRVRKVWVRVFIWAAALVYCLLIFLHAQMFKFFE